MHAHRLGWENLRAHPLDIVRTTVLSTLAHHRPGSDPVGVPLLIVLAHRFCYGFVCFGHARYRHVAEVAMCLLAGLFLSQVAAPRPARPQRAG